MLEDDFINMMSSFVGVAENPMGSNRTPIGEEFGWNGVSWCAETVSVSCRRLGFPLYEAAVIRIEERAKRGDYGLKWTRTPTRGAITCFDFGGHGNPADMHTGVLRDVLENSRFYNIEGNHRDRCEVVLRDMKFVRGFALPPFDKGTATSVKLKQEIITMDGKGFVSSPVGDGGWAFQSDGGVFTDGDARFFGSIPKMIFEKLIPKLNASIVALVPTPTGQGYALIGEDGGVFNFGDATWNAYPALPREYKLGARKIIGASLMPNGRAKLMSNHMESYVL